MNYLKPFAPHYGSTQTIAPAVASATISLTKQDQQVRILNTGAAIAYIKIGDSTAGAVVATVADYPVAPGQSTVITKGVNDNTLAHISPTGSTLVVTTGNGF